MRILAIETSCDETAAAVVENGNKILASTTATSAGIHARTGGIIPEDAARKQILAAIPTIEVAISDAKIAIEQIDAIAVTVGPGLIGSLLVGVETAKTLGRLWGKPVIPVNHMLGHIYACWIEAKSPPLFPAMALVVSGGHTDLVVMKDHPSESSGQVIKLVGTTRDDAAGEAFDKIARLLGLSYPGGAKISKLAEKYRAEHPNEKLALLPRPMVHDDNYDWSFSGLKTAVLNNVKQIMGKRGDKMRLSDYEEISKTAEISQQAERLAAETQEAICEVLVAKSMRAVDEYKPRSFLVTGGVAANKRLRVLFTESLSDYPTGITLHVPEPSLCTDNAAMIGAAAYHVQNKTEWQNVSANPQLVITDEIASLD